MCSARPSAHRSAVRTVDPNTHRRPVPAPTTPRPTARARRARPAGREVGGMCSARPSVPRSAVRPVDPNTHRRLVPAPTTPRRHSTSPAVPAGPAARSAVCAALGTLCAGRRFEPSTPTRTADPCPHRQPLGPQHEPDGPGRAGVRSAVRAALGTLCPGRRFEPSTPTRTADPCRTDDPNTHRRLVPAPTTATHAADPCPHRGLASWANGSCAPYPKIVRCQGLAATPVRSYITCLTVVYSSKE